MLIEKRGWHDKKSYIERKGEEAIKYRRNRKDRKTKAKL